MLRTCSLVRRHRPCVTTDTLHTPREHCAPPHPPAHSALLLYLSLCSVFPPIHLRRYPNPLQFTDNVLVLTGPSQNVGDDTAEATFYLPTGYGEEYDLVSLQGDYLFLGARPLAGGFVTTCVSSINIVHHWGTDH